MARSSSGRIVARRSPRIMEALVAENPCLLRNTLEGSRKVFMIFEEEDAEEFEEDIGLRERVS